mmetsp:Transcript_56515/g.134249  ORF Transcript_56515/g.134249 Transcript_56515/m.134249 type:complete len:753 (+) Transcript_56515:82-2340(+)
MHVRASGAIDRGAVLPRGSRRAVARAHHLHAQIAVRGYQDAAGAHQVRGLASERGGRVAEAPKPHADPVHDDEGAAPGNGPRRLFGAAPAVHDGVAARTPPHLSRHATPEEEGVDTAGPGAGCATHHAFDLPLPHHPRQVAAGTPLVLPPLPRRLRPRPALLGANPRGPPRPREPRKRRGGWDYDVGRERTARYGRRHPPPDTVLPVAGAARHGHDVALYTRALPLGPLRQSRCSRVHGGRLQLVPERNLPGLARHAYLHRLGGARGVGGRRDENRDYPAGRPPGAAYQGARSEAKPSLALPAHDRALDLRTAPLRFPTPRSVLPHRHRGGNRGHRAPPEVLPEGVESDVGDAPNEAAEQGGQGRGALTVAGQELCALERRDRPAPPRRRALAGTPGHHRRGVRRWGDQILRGASGRRDLHGQVHRTPLGDADRPAEGLHGHACPGVQRDLQDDGRGCARGGLAMDRRGVVGSAGVRTPPHGRLPRPAMPPLRNRRRADPGYQVLEQGGPGSRESPGPADSRAGACDGRAGDGGRVGRLAALRCLRSTPRACRVADDVPLRQRSSDHARDRGQLRHYVEADPSAEADPQRAFVAWRVPPTAADPRPGAVPRPSPRPDPRVCRVLHRDHRARVLDAPLARRVATLFRRAAPPRCEEPRYLCRQRGGREGGRGCGGRSCGGGPRCGRCSEQGGAVHPGGAATPVRDHASHRHRYDDPPHFAVMPDLRSEAAGKGSVRCKERGGRKELVGRQGAG